MPRTNRRSKASDKHAAKKAAAKRTRKLIERRRLAKIATGAEK